ncbi:hypothetical protein [Streptomyces pinistramenti]|uniref:hypothetical protein n=1 Tax=Streptomyces pinistramenti TaxID=2884812 RepID=UPI001D0790B5|nr:hypothetical protein [Streptomyces pinistramenti]MCB5911774.1 hypothetical protein [Streptomyces pinistramenti]
MYPATPHGGALRAVRVPRAQAPAARLRTALLRHWRQAQRAAAMNVRTGTVKRGRA